MTLKLAMSSAASPSQSFLVVDMMMKPSFGLASSSSGAAQGALTQVKRKRLCLVAQDVARQRLEPGHVEDLEVAPVHLQNALGL